MTDDPFSGTAGDNPKGPTPLVRRRRPRSARQALEPEMPPPGPPHRRSKTARRPLIVFADFCLSFALLGVLALASVAWLGRGSFYAPGPLRAEQVVEIARGSSVDTIAQALHDQGVISNPYVFMTAAEFTGATGKMKAGEYKFPVGISMADIMQQMIDGKVLQHLVTIPEGLTSQQVVDILNNSDVLNGPVQTIPTEGSLLPETYSVTRGTGREELIHRMQAAQHKAVAEIWAQRSSDLPLKSPHDLVTLASIVEKETGKPGERPQVAAVFLNRLKRNMPLQSDPTVLYGLNGGSAWDHPRTLFKSDLNRPTPYNTYLIKGLPPGPIANPGRAALEATANPAETKDLYFVADGTGGHVFAATYDQHQRNVAHWRSIEATRNN